MRKLYLWLAIVALLLTGCADLAKLLPQEDTSDPVEVYVAPTPQPFPAEVSTAARIRERGEMIVGIRYDLEPFSYVAEDGMVAGLEVDLARELARRWLGDAEAVRFVQVRSDTALQHLQDGRVDFALAGLIHSQGLASSADFGPPYFMNGQALLTFPDTNVSSVADLGGQRVGVLTWSESLAALDAAAPVTVTYVPYDDYFQIVEALRTRQIDIYADRRHRLERARRTVAGTTIVGQYTWEPVAMAYRENDPFFADLVAATCWAMAQDGTRDALYARWLPGTSPPAPPDWPGVPPVPALTDAPRERYTGDRIAVIRERGSVAVGYFPDRWPYSADRGDGVQTGFEVRLLERMVERWLGTREAITFVPVTEGDAFQRLQNGEVDILVGGWIHTWDAEAEVAFSHTLFDDGVGIFSLANVALNSLAELGGQGVGVIAGTAGEAALPEIAQRAGVGINATTYPDVGTATAALRQGEVAALVAERRILLDPLYREGGYYLTDKRFTYRPVAYVLPRGDSAFRDLVNLTLATLRANGAFTELYTTWFDDAVPEAQPWPGQPVIGLTIAP